VFLRVFRLGIAWSGTARFGVGSVLHRTSGTGMELVTADRELEIVLLRVLRKARKGLAWRDRARPSEAWTGEEWHG
jgi:hypothetical protein